MRCFLFVTLLLFVAPNETQAQSQGNVGFKISTGGNITCALAGYKCGYTETDFTSVNGEQNTGQISAGGYGGVGNLIWSPLNATTDFIQFTKCVNNSCLVVCNVGCSCTTSSGSACPTGTLAPTKAPTMDTTTGTCPNVQNTQYCSQLNSILSAGNLDNFDCFNFCGGIRVGTCAFTKNGGQCGSLTCQNASNSGVNGLVQGCTKQLLLGATTTAGSATSKKSSSHFLSAGFSLVLGGLLSIVLA